MFTVVNLLEVVSSRPSRARIHEIDRRKMFEELWEALDAWMEAVWMEGRTASIAMFATFGWELVGGAAPTRRPAFRLTRQFRRSVGLKINTVDKPFFTKVVEFDPLRIAIKHSRTLNKDLAYAGMLDFAEALSDLVSGSDPFSIGFKIGRLVRTGGSSEPTFHFDSMVRDRVLSATTIPATTLRLWARTAKASSGESKDAEDGAGLLGRSGRTHTVPPTARTVESTMDSHRPASAAPPIPHLNLERDDKGRLVPRRATSTSRTTSSRPDPVMEAAYENFERKMKHLRRQDKKSQKQYDEAILKFEEDLVEDVRRRAMQKQEFRLRLQNQRAAIARRKAEESHYYSKEPGWDDVNGSILPTMGIGKLQEHAAFKLPDWLESAGIPPMELAVIRAEASMQATKKAHGETYLRSLEKQFADKAVAAQRRKEEDIVVERKAAEEQLLEEIDAAKAKMAARMRKSEQLMQSWKRDMQLQKKMKDKANKAVRKQQLWKQQMSKTIADRAAASLRPGAMTMGSAGSGGGGGGGGASSRPPTSGSYRSGGYTMPSSRSAASLRSFGAPRSTGRRSTFRSTLEF